LNNVLIRKAIIRDIKPIHRLLSYYAEQGLLLPRALSDLYDHLRDHFVIETKNQEQSIVAVSALGICWEDLAEIRSLAVAEDHKRKGFGSHLVKMCLKEAKALGLTKVFALTYAPEFFTGLGFIEVEKSILPHKVWSDCLKCPKFPDCDETAMMIDIS